MNEYREFADKVKCLDGDKVYFIPKKLFARIIMAYKYPDRRYVRYKTGAEMYDMSERQFIELSAQAKARCKINRMVLVDLEKFDRYLECFVME